jgi:ABC-type ATPase with predicted acetyltransferase domain
MAVWRCPQCAQEREARCKPKKCPTCDQQVVFEKKEQDPKEKK